MIVKESERKYTVEFSKLAQLPDAQAGRDTKICIFPVKNMDFKDVSEYN